MKYLQAISQYFSKRTIKHKLLLKNVSHKIFLVRTQTIARWNRCHKCQIAFRIVSFVRMSKFSHFGILTFDSIDLFVSRYENDKSNYLCSKCKYDNRAQKYFYHNLAFLCESCDNQIFFVQISISVATATLVIFLIVVVFKNFKNSIVASSKHLSLASIKIMAIHLQV